MARNAENFLYSPFPAADRRRIDLFCVILRKIREERDHSKAARQIIQKAQLFIKRSSCDRVCDLLQQRALEWLWLHDCAMPFILHWPERAGSRRKLLTICLASGRLPPADAVSWLSGIARPRSVEVYWPRVWAEGARALLANTGRRMNVVKTAPVCMLAGTAVAEVRELPIIDWEHTSVQVVFSQVYRMARQTFGQKISQLEQEWWERISDAFPGSRPVRHYRLPGSRMHLDMYWPDRRVGLEIQGIQHWRPVERFGGTAAFARRQEADAAKRAWCRRNGIHLVEVTQDTPVSSALAVLSGYVFCDSRAVYSLRRAQRAP